MFAIDLGLANIDDGTNGSVLVHIYYRAMAICMGVQKATHIPKIAALNIARKMLQLFKRCISK